jgi:SAM-dependent methyltransferase
MTEKLYVQYGCGLAAPEGWLNFDSSPRLKFERLPGVGRLADGVGKRLFPRNVVFGEIVRGLPVADASVDGIYASHVLEHLGRKDVEQALANTLRMLKPGGVFRMIVPDLHWRAMRYVRQREQGEIAAADVFLAATGLGETARPRSTFGLLRSALGNSGHRWLYDAALMTTLLTDAGFVDIKRCAFNDSGDPMFDRVEDKGRFFDSGEAELALQARKPVLAGMERATASMAPAGKPSTS